MLDRIWWSIVPCRCCVISLIRPVQTLKLTLFYWLNFFSNSNFFESIFSFESTFFESIFSWSFYVLEKFFGLCKFLKNFLDFPSSLKVFLFFPSSLRFFLKWVVWTPNLPTLCLVGFLSVLSNDNFMDPFLWRCGFHLFLGNYVKIIDSWEGVSWVCPILLHGVPFLTPILRYWIIIIVGAGGVELIWLVIALPWSWITIIVGVEWVFISLPFSLRKWSIETMV